MRDATFAFIDVVRRRHKLHNHETDPWKLAHLEDVQIISGKRNYANAGPPAVIVLARDGYLARRRFTLFHELGHVIMKREGLEDAIGAEVDDEDADAHIEAVVNFAAGLYLLPDPMVNKTLRQYGFTPRGIVQLAKVGQVSLPAAMRRAVSSDLDAERAAFVTSGNYIADVATCGRGLPFTRYDRVPELRLIMPDAAMLRLAPRKTMGTVTW